MYCRRKWARSPERNGIRESDNGQGLNAVRAHRNNRLEFAEFAFCPSTMCTHRANSTGQIDGLCNRHSNEGEGEHWRVATALQVGLTASNLSTL